MSDFLFILAREVDFSSDLESEILAHLHFSCSNVLPHNLLSRVRITVRSEPGGISIEPQVDSRIKGDVITSLVGWASKHSKIVSIRLEGHRKNNTALPAIERRTEALEDVLSFRGYGHKPHNIEFELLGN